MKHIKKFEAKYTVLKHYKKVDGKFVNTMEDTEEEEPQRDFSMVNADEVRRIARENAQREYEKKLAEEQRLRDIEINRRNDIAAKLKTELDLVFVDIIDRYISTYCTYSDDQYITYSFEIRYKINQNIDSSAKTFKKISEDILDIEAYLKYLKTKHDINGYTNFANTNGIYKLFIFMKIKDVK